MLEIACFEMTSAEIALQSVADRIEFCSAIEHGGLTPDYEEFCYLKNNYTKPIYVMIRSVGGGFFYSEDEFVQMKREIVQFREAGADGFVFGVLDQNNEVDVLRNTELKQLAGGLPCTFHRAVDRTPDIFRSVATLAQIGFSSVLTSGGKTNAVDGAENLAKLEQMFGNTIQILVGGGVRAENIQQLKDITGCRHFHSSAIRKYEMFANAEEIKLLKASAG